MKIAYVFPGQGSQYKGMGEELFENFKDLTAKADKILGFSIKELCLEDPYGQLGQTAFTQPALYVVNSLSYLQILNETNVKPDYVAGHSLGEYNALFAAGVFDFETGLKLVKRRGELMAQSHGGGMAAIIGLKDYEVEKVLKDRGFLSIDIANYNTPSQIVISGPRDDIRQAKEAFLSVGAKLYVELNVSGAFHSRYMSQCKNEFEKYIEQFHFSPIEIPIISNVSARPYIQSQIGQNLSNQITNSVRWSESVRYLMGQEEMDIKQIGPGNVLTGLIQKIKAEAEPLLVLDKQDDLLDEFLEERTKISGKKASIIAGNSKVEFDQVKKITPIVTASSLGDEEFKKDYGIKYAYVTGAMYRGIASKELVIRVAKAGFLGFFGTGGLKLDEIEKSIKYIKAELNSGEAYGMNLLSSPFNPEKEEKLVDLLLEYNVKNIEAAAFTAITEALVKYRLTGLKNENGVVRVSNKIMAKVSRPEVAEAFLKPAPERIIRKLVQEGKINAEEAKLSREIPMADDLCIEADSGGHTDHGVAYALIPTMIRLRDRLMKDYSYKKRVRVGAAGGIGTPDAAAAAFVMGADFILTGSINQCTIEAGTSDSVKDLLQQMNVQDTEYVPAGDMFEMGAKVQVLKRGLFFPSRANKLYELYRHYNSLDEIDNKTKKQLQEKYFKRSFDDIFNDIKSRYSIEEIEKAERNPKHKMALIFRWYFGYTTHLALNGIVDHKVDYQIHCGPSLGAFNQWVRGTVLEDWRARHVDEIADKLMKETAVLLNQRFISLI
ncbi:ACP S-malonyltransferase [Priestia megaterium]|uniref:ACP S-malonyltransferase n=1 Tax=Priestia megaterium TaxID=1404 RepID=UPI0012D8BE0C|nr:Polyketide biosynthesis protein PksE [Priestia megaterium]